MNVRKQISCMKELSLWIYASTKLSCILTNGTNVTQIRISIERTRYDILITIVMYMYVTEQIMENLEPRSVALGSRRREYAHPR